MTRRVVDPVIRAAHGSLYNNDIITSGITVVLYSM